MKRRQVIRGSLAAGAGLAAAALFGCGGDDGETPKTTPAPAAGAPSGAASEYAINAKLVAEYAARAKEEGAPANLPYNYLEPDTKPKTGGTLTLGTGIDFTSSIKTFDPHSAASSGHANVSVFTANRLVGWVNGPNMSKYKVELQPELAKSWEVSPDGLTFTFRIQQGVKYHNLPPVNGRVFKAQDVQLAYERAAKEGVNVPLFGLVDRVSAPDDQTLRITMKRPDADFLIPLGADGMPIYPPELYDQDLIASKSIGTGPAILEELSRASSARLRSNPDYWEGKPLLDGVQWRIIPDVAARLAAFRAGQIDWGNTLVSTQAEIDALKRTNPQALITGNPILNSTYTYVLNPAHPKFKDARVRQAFAVAVDRKRLVDLAFQGYGKVVPGLPWIYIFDKLPSGGELGPWYRYDVAEAKKLLAAAGVDALTFELKFAAASYGPANGDAQNAAMVSFFKDVGATMTLKNMDNADYNGYISTRKFVTEPGEAIFGYVTGAATANNFYWAGVHSKSVTNTTGVNDPQIDEWAERQRSELDAKTRKELLRKIWDRMQDQVYRLDIGDTFKNSVLQGWVRYWRFNGPLLAIYNITGCGRGYHKGWLDK